MTTRGFLMWYVGAVIVVGGAGASAYQALLRLHAATPAAPVAVAQADVPPPTSAIPTLAPAPEPPQAASLPKLRPHLAATSKSLPLHRKRVAAGHAPVRRPNAIVSARREIPPDSPWAYPPPPPPGLGYYAYPARYPYPGYYPYYPRYGYYRTF